MMPMRRRWPLDYAGDEIQDSVLTLLRYRRLVTSSLTVFLLGLVLAGGAERAGAAAYLPPPGKIFAGVADNPISAYVGFVHKHPAVYQEFLAWGQYLPGITADATAVRARMMMMISTMYGSREAITPEGIAQGRGDAWLIGLNRQIAASRNVTYIRLMAEMNNVNNVYSDCGRGASHSASAFRQAWKRATLILRGGSLKHIDAVLRRLRLPALHARGDLPTPKVSMMWVPMVQSNCGPGPAAYFPGRAWVDWVGTDFYSKFPNWGGLNAFYGQFGRLPFVFGEYALWGGDDPGFVNQLFAWAFSHPRVRMMIYNQGAMTTGPFRLLHYPRAAAALRRQLAGSRFPAYAPEWRTR
jgi:hypothetical protein